MLAKQTKVWNINKLHAIVNAQRILFFQQNFQKVSTTSLDFSIAYFKLAQHCSINSLPMDFFVCMYACLVFRKWSTDLHNEWICESYFYFRTQWQPNVSKKHATKYETSLNHCIAVSIDERWHIRIQYSFQNENENYFHFFSFIYCLADCSVIA